MQAVGAPQPARQRSASGIVEVELLDPEALVERHLANGVREVVPRRPNLEDDVRRDGVFFPLHVRLPIPLRSPERDHDIGGHPGLVVTLDGIQEQVARDEVGETRSRLPFNVTIHSHCSVLSDIGSPSQSG